MTKYYFEYNLWVNETQIPVRSSFYDTKEIAKAAKMDTINGLASSVANGSLVINLQRDVCFKYIDGYIVNDRILEADYDC